MYAQIFSLTLKVCISKFSKHSNHIFVLTDSPISDFEYICTVFYIDTISTASADAVVYTCLRMRCAIIYSGSG